MWEALLEVVSPAGTVIVPTYYMSGGTIYSTCQDKDYCFDPRRHGTGLGALPAAFLELPEVKRSIHPTHSVSAIGKHAGYVTEAHHLAPSIFGRGSPWQRCHELDGKVLGLGVSMGPVTFYHLLEDRMLDAFPLPVRMRETFPPAVSRLGRAAARGPVVPLDPAFMTRRIDHKSRDDLREYFWRDFELAGLLQAGRVGESRSWFVGSRRFYSHLLALMNEGITIYTLPDGAGRSSPGRPATGAAGTVSTGGRRRGDGSRVLHVRAHLTTPPEFEKRWRGRFEDFGAQGDDDASIAGWSSTGLDARRRNFARLWRPGRPGARWLDVGCGAGTYTRLPGERRGADDRDGLLAADAAQGALAQPGPARHGAWAT